MPRWPYLIWSQSDEERQLRLSFTQPTVYLEPYMLPYAVCWAQYLVWLAACHVYLRR
jgi:hypothetical protein